MVPEYVILHTAASGRAGIEWDVSCAEIDRWHRAKLWDCIGYHYVIRLGGEVEVGRGEWRQGAHCLGWNSRSLGVCFAGHGDYFMWSGEQLASGLAVVAGLLSRYRIPVCRVLGHRETGAVRSCPGTAVSMEVIRGRLASMGLPCELWPAVPARKG